MKKTFAIFALCLLVLLGGVIAAVTVLHDDRDDVTVTVSNVKGDPAAAEGFTAQQSAHFQHNLRWDLTIPLAHPENTETVFSRQNNLSYGGEGALVNCAVYISTPSSSKWLANEKIYDLEEAFLTDPNLAVYRDFLPMVKETQEETPNSKRHSKTFLLKDHLEVYPMAVEAHAPYTVGPRSMSELGDAWQDFFAFPVPEEEAWTITMEKGTDGAILAFDLTCDSPAYSPNVLAAYAGNRLFFTLDGNSSGACVNTPGGFGIYAPAVVWEDGNPWHQMDSLSNVFPLPQETEVLDLAAAADGENLLLTYRQEEVCTFAVIDPETMAVADSFSLPGQAPERIFWGDGFLLFCGEETFHLYQPQGDTYAHVFTAPMEDHIRNAEDYLLRAVWNGGQLAIATADGQSRLPGLTLSIFEDGALAYQGVYETSLNQDKQEGSYPDDFVFLLSGRELELAWEG